MPSLSEKGYPNRARNTDCLTRSRPPPPRAPLEFRELDTPTYADIAEVAARTAARVEKILRAHGRSLDPELGDDTPPELALDEPGLAACYAAAAQGVAVSGDRAGKPPLRLIASPDPPARPRAADATDQPIAEVRGINIHAAQVVDGRDRRRVERLCKYITRPPVAQDRLERRPDGKLELSFKRAWRDGTRALVFEPADLIPRLVAAVPPPRWHLLRYFGVLSSHSSRRRLVVPQPPPDPTANKPPPARGDQLALLGDEDDAPTPRKRWAWLLALVFAADVETCPRCSGPMRWAEVVSTVALAKPGARILVIGFSYDAAASGPPFPIDRAALEALYAPFGAVELLDERDITDESPRFRERGATRVHEAAFLVTLR